MEAWGDESIRIVGSPPLYLLAATYVPDGGSVDISSLESVKPRGAEKLHWRDMGDRSKVQSSTVIASLGVAHTIVIGCGVSKNKQERARRKCLEVLLPELERMGVTQYILESRGPDKDKRDVEFLLTMRRKGLCGVIDISHEPGADNSFLWIPDQVLGLCGDVRCGTANEALVSAWVGISDSATLEEISL